MTRELEKASTEAKTMAEKQRKEAANAKKLQKTVDEMTKQIEQQKGELAKFHESGKETTQPTGALNTALVSEASPSNERLEKEKEKEAALIEEKKAK